MAAETLRARSREQNLVAIVLAVMIWGLAFIPAKIALREIPPPALLFLRFALVVPIFIPMLLRYRSGVCPWRALALHGFIGVTVYLSLQIWGLRFTTATSAGMILGVKPALIAILSAIILREPIPPLRGTGIVVSIAGVALLVWGNPAGSEETNSLCGDCLIFLSALCWSAYVIMTKHTKQNPSSIKTAGSITFGALFLALLRLPAMGEVSLERMSIAAWLSVAYLGLAASAGAYALWNKGLSGVSASEADAYLNLAPVVTTVGAFVLLKEHVVVSQWIGGALVLAGVLLCGIKLPARGPTPQGLRPTALATEPLRNPPPVDHLTPPEEEELP